MFSKSLTASWLSNGPLISKIASQGADYGVVNEASQPHPSTYHDYITSLISNKNHQIVQRGSVL